MTCAQKHPVLCGMCGIPCGILCGIKPNEINAVRYVRYPYTRDAREVL